MLQVKIDQTFGQIAVKQSLPVTKINIVPPNIKIQRDPGAFKISIDWPKVQLESTASRASLGYRGLLPFQKHYASKGQLAAHSYIQRVAQEGDRLGRTEVGGNPIAEMAKLAAWPEKEANIAMLPSAPPKVTSSGGLNIKAKTGDLKLHSIVNTPQVEAGWGKVDVSLKVKPSLNIEVSGQWIDLLG